MAEDEKTEQAAEEPVAEETQAVPGAAPKRSRKKAEPAAEAVTEEAAVEAVAAVDEPAVVEEPVVTEEPAVEAVAAAEAAPAKAPKAAAKAPAAKAPAAKAPAKKAAAKPAAPKAKAKAEKPKERKPIVRTPRPIAEPGRKQERRGVVVSDKGDKTIVVKVDTIKAHPRYQKVVRRSAKFHAHDEANSAKVGDTVRIVETRPLSAMKHWRLVEIVEVAK